MVERFKIRYGKIITAFTRDDAEFKESEHPRKKNGQFGKGNGSNGISKGVTKPKPNTHSGKIWDLIDELKSSGKYPSAKEVTAAGEKAGFSFNPATVSTQMHHHKKYHAGAETPAEAAPPPKKEIPNTKSNFLILANELGFPYKEGSFNGKTYYKNEAGEKLSFSESSGTWAYLKDGVAQKVGLGLADLVDSMKDLATPGSLAASHAAAKQTQAEFAEKQKKYDEQKKVEAANALKTHTAPNYAHVMPESKFKFSSKGIADESGLPKGVQDSIARYCGPHYKAINKAMRFTQDFSSIHKDTLVDIINIQRAFQCVPGTREECEVGRKIDLDALKVMAKNAGLGSLDELAVGSVLNEPGVVSTSHKVGTWSGSANFRIKVPKGFKAIDVSETINKGEAEAILAPGTSLRITSIKKNHQYFDYYIECEAF